MKNLIYIFSFLTIFSLPAFSQEEEFAGKIPERMATYIENKLYLEKGERDKFHPLFIEYLKELRKTSNDYRDDKLVMHQKIADLRLRYRDSFKSIMGEKKANDVFFHEREFMREAMELRRERMERRGGPKRKLN